MHKTYQDAKIERPNACICRDRVSGMFFAMPSKEGTILSDTSEFAEAKDHCMTVDEFLNSGRRLDVGDLFIDCFGQVVEIKEENVDTVNIPHEYDNARCILRAAALEKPKRTKVEYVECELTRKEFVCELIDGGTLYKESGKIKLYFDEFSGKLKGKNESGNSWDIVIDSGTYLRRIETEIDERQEFIDSACDALDGDVGIASSMGVLYDSGKFKLVN